MKTQRNTQPAPARGKHTAWPTTISAAVLAVISLAANAHAQANGQQPPARTTTTEEKPAQAWIDRRAFGEVFYSIKFDGGATHRLKQLWKDAFPDDNFVITPSAVDVQLPPFEIHNMRLTELARCIAFLSQGALTVEAVDESRSAAGTIWRVGTPSTAEAPTVKMRAVAAPNLFAKGRIDGLVDFAQKIDEERRALTRQRVTEGEIAREINARVIPLPDQKVVVVMGSENSIAGIESFIQAAERAASPYVGVQAK